LHDIIKVLNIPPEQPRKKII